MKTTTKIIINDNINFRSVALNIFFSRHLELLGCVSPEYPFMLMEATTYSVVFFVSHMIIFSHYSTIFFLIPLCSLFGFEGKKIV